MTTRIRFALFSLGLAVAFFTLVGAARALDSDRLVITDLTSGAVLFDATTAEGGAAGEPSLSFGAPFPLPPLPPGTDVVLLTEPSGEVPDSPPFFVPGTNEVISDLIFSTLRNPTVPTGVLLVSDGDPNFGLWVSAALGLPFTAVPETGDLQDLTPLLSDGHLQVQVQSDVVPEPDTELLVGIGLVGMAVRRRIHLRS